MWQQEFTWFFALFHQESSFAIRLLYASLCAPPIYAQRVARFDHYWTHNCLSPKK